MRKLVLEDGSEYYGYGFGADTDRVCEIVFNTSMVGYQEIVSDPSYTNQMVVMTYPLIGNYGITDEDYETKSPTIGGLIVREYNDLPSNFRYTKTLSETMEEYHIPGISGIDTRCLTRSIRDLGSRRVLITSPDMPKEEALRIIAQTPVSMKPDGIFLSNGPGDPEDVTPVIELIRALRGKYPIFGICLGHQMISLAYGAKTYKLKFGHRGGNHPVKNLLTGKIEITSQNHSYAVDKASVAGTGLEVTHVNLLDDTVEGVRCVRDRVFSVQYHPESAPGPQDSAYLFDEFIALMKEGN